MAASPRPDQRWIDRMAPVLDHVRENLRDDLSVDALARVAHFSPYHFHRVFTAVVGETVGTFVRRARLERAIQLMRSAPTRPLGSVALDAGFGSLSDFSRSFRRAYGLPPSRWNRRTPLTFREDGSREDASSRGATPGAATDGTFDAVPGASAGAAPGAAAAPIGDEATGVSSELPWNLEALVDSDAGPPVRVVMRETPAWTLAYVRVRRPFEKGALQRGYDHLRRWIDGRGLPRGELLGLSWDDVLVTPPDQIRYDVACTVPPDARLPPTGGPAAEGVGARCLPPLRLATARADGDLARVARVWDHLYHDWLPSSSYEPFDLPAFEWYAGWPERMEGGSWSLDCCIPLRALRGG